MNRLERSALFAAVLVATTSLAHAQSQTIQKWVDDKGRVHFGDMPPPEAKTSTIQLKVTPPSESPPKAAPAGKPDTPAIKAGDNKGPSAAERRAAEEQRAAESAAAKEHNQRIECQSRLQKLQREAQAARRAGPSPAFDAWAAKEDAYLAQNCK